MKIFSGTSNPPLAEKIASALQLSISPIENHLFPDGERRVMLEENVVDQDVIVVQPTATPADNNYIELFLIVDAAQQNGARSITVVMPYMGYQRQDHIFRIGESASLSVMIKMLEALKVDQIICLDLHSIKIPEMFHIPITHLSALSLFAQTVKHKKWNDGKTVLVSPDMGGIRRIKQLSEMISSMPFATIEKNRDLKTGNINVSKIEGDIKKRAIIVDDMISSGKTIVAAADLLKENGAEEVYVFVTHGVFSDIAPKLLQNSIVKKVFITDSVFVPKEKHFSKLEVISIAKMIALELKKG